MLCPAMAAARAYPPAPLPGNPVVRATDPGTGLAVDDRGRVAVVVPQGTGTAVAIGAPGGAWTVAPLPGIDTPGDLLFRAGGGAVVGYGTADSHEDAGSDGPKGAAPCCQRPFVFRWRPGAPPRRQTIVPLDGVDREVEAFAVDHDGTAYAILDQESDDAVDSEVTLAAVRVPAHGAPARRTLATDGSIVGYPAGLRASERGAGATVAWDGGTAMRRLTATPGGWRADRPPVPALEDDAQAVYLDPRGRPIHVFQHGDHLMLQDAAGRRRVLGRNSAPAGWQDAVGADGTLAVLWAHGSTLYERVLDRHRHLGPTRVLGPVVRSNREVTYAVAVDARGGVHTAWMSPDGTIVVQFPGGRRVLSRGAVPLTGIGLAVSPGGATAAFFVAGTQRLVAVTTRP
jgi:hypothetical protein